MNPAIEQAVADALPHESHACTTGRCRCGAEKKRNVLLAKIRMGTPDGYVYLRRNDG